MLVCPVSEFNSIDSHLYAYDIDKDGGPAPRSVSLPLVRVVAGVVTSLVRKYTKKGELMATFTLEDLESAIEVWVFPRTMQECGYLLNDDAIVT